MNGKRIWSSQNNNLGVDLKILKRFKALCQEDEEENLNSEDNIHSDVLSQTYYSALSVENIIEPISSSALATLSHPLISPIDINTGVTDSEKMEQDTDEKKTKTIEKEFSTKSYMDYQGATFGIVLQDRSPNAIPARALPATPLNPWFLSGIPNFSKATQVHLAITPIKYDIASRQSLGQVDVLRQTQCDDTNPNGTEDDAIGLTSSQEGLSSSTEDSVFSPVPFRGSSAQHDEPRNQESKMGLLARLLTEKRAQSDLENDILGALLDDRVK